MRVLLLNTGAVPVPPPFGGGVERHTYHLARALAEQGAAVDYVTSLAPGAYFPPGVTLHELPRFDFRIQSAYPLVALGQAVGAAAATSTARRLLNGHPPDVLSVQTNATAWGTVHLAQARSVVTTFTVHNPTPGTLRFTSGALTSTRRVTYRMLDEPTMRSVDGLIVLNQALADEVRARLGAQSPETCVIPPIVDLEPFSKGGPADATIRAQYQLDRGYCLFVGRLMEQKGVRYLLEALRGTGVPLVVVGDGPERPALVRQLQGSGGASEVRFLSGVPSSHVPAIYRGASVLALPSLAEGLPAVGVEGLAAGLPIVASRIPGLGDIVQDGANGALVPPRDVAALREALLRYTSDPAAAAAAGAKSRERATELFSWDSIARRTLDFYRHLLAKR